MSNLLYGLHDREGRGIVPAGGWIVDTIALSESPAPMDYAAMRGDINWLVRVNWSYGSTGTIPMPSQYAEFARRAADYIARSKGCTRWIIANEPNHSNERPDGQKITPPMYIDCFKQVHTAVREGAGTSHGLIPAPVALWNVETGDWLQYQVSIWEGLWQLSAGVAIHTYTHGANPQLITSPEKMGAPYQDRFYHFQAYRDLMIRIPSRMRGLPVYITETDQNEAWADVNSGWVQEAYAEIDRWNKTDGTQKIHCLALYRWPRYDKWYIEGKHGVIADFNAAVNRGYQSPDSNMPLPIPPQPQPTPPDNEREIDPRLVARGVRFEFAQPAAGTYYWRLASAEWLDEAAADAVGPDHHILGQVLLDGLEVANIPLRVEWPSGNTTIYSKTDDPNASYNYDFPMSSSLNEYAITVADGQPSDKVSGIGMGKDGNPSIHTSTWLLWEYVQAKMAPVPPTPGGTHREYVTTPAGANLRTEPVTGAILVAVPYGEHVEVDGQQQASDGYIWKHSTYFFSMFLGYIEGWIRGDLLSLLPPSPAPPILEPDGEVVHPLPGAVITQHWGESAPEYSPGMWGHAGTDLGAPSGTPIRAIADGIVDLIDFDGDGYGHFLFVIHRQLKLRSLYAHCESVEGMVGKVVTAGEIIARVGSSGNSTGPHLHLELRQLNENGGYAATTPMPKGRIDPETWLSLQGVKL